LADGDVGNIASHLGENNTTAKRRQLNVKETV